MFLAGWSAQRQCDSTVTLFYAFNTSKKPSYALEALMVLALMVLQVTFRIRASLACRETLTAMMGGGGGGEEECDMVKGN